MFLQELRDIVGNENVSDSTSDKLCYSCDASQEKGMPDFIVRPKTAGEISEIVKLAAKENMPVVTRGAGSGLAGGAVPIRGGIVLDMSSMNKILDIDIDNLQVTLQPGVVHTKLNEILKPYGFFFPPDPGSTKMCTIGGLIANNGSGMRSVKYGTTLRYVLDLEVVLADGSIIRTGSKTLKTASGYDLTSLMVGSEGTLGVITEVVLRIHPLPRTRLVILLTFESLGKAGEAVVRTLSSGVIPSACEILDNTTITALKAYDPSLDLPDSGDMLMMEVDGNEGAVKDAVRTVKEVCKDLAMDIRAASTEEENEKLWAARRVVGAAITRLDPKRNRVYVGEDVGVPIKHIPEMIEHVRVISKEVGMPIMIYGHIGDGNLHTGMSIDMLNKDEWDKLFRIADLIYRKAIELGGTVSAEHGIGSARGKYMKLEHPTSMPVMLAIKKALDPQGIMNPGKLGLEDF
ncbi:FAD-binding oxidoreductase [Methanohalophilus sp.]|uniref:FAD-binding oxidoreductase n=1 Tax=Methanohalophilus sp. TaxID=1966352 RepID=UPI002636979A|nr:FAD-binding oxidoreductase [Methanohalophilus sp.]MDK2893009.1 glycolate oxidase [Methanohalophilus sp.]